MVDRTWLITTLAASFQSVVPEGFVVLRVETDRPLYSGELVIFGPGTLERWARVYAQELEDGEVEAIAESMASNIQDTIAEATTVPWPGTKQMPNPDLAVREGVLHVWYGDEADPTLKLEPISLR